MEKTIEKYQCGNRDNLQLSFSEARNCGHLYDSNKCVLGGNCSVLEKYTQTSTQLSHIDTHPEADLLAHIIAETPDSRIASDSAAVHPSDSRASRRGIKNIFGKQVSSFSP